VTHIKLAFPERRWRPDKGKDCVVKRLYSPNRMAAGEKEEKKDMTERSRNKAQGREGGVRKNLQEVWSLREKRSAVKPENRKRKKAMGRRVNIL